MQQSTILPNFKPINENEAVRNHESVHLYYRKSGDNWWPWAIDPSGELAGKAEGKEAFPSFQVAIAGRAQNWNSTGGSGYSGVTKEMRMTQFRVTDDLIESVHTHDVTGLEVKVELEFIAGTSAIRQRTIATNRGNEEIVLTHLSSMHQQGIALDGIRPWYDKSKILVHYCRQAWEGEGQWKAESLEDLGLVKTSVHSERAVAEISSIGSFSTSKYLPMMIVEDRETSKSWFVELEAPSSWSIELGYRQLETSGSLYLLADGANERISGWARRLEPGESFEAIPAVFGCCDGSFAEAVEELHRYKRSCCRNVPAIGHYPITFNDYMNCLWANPTSEKLVPLIDTAAELGVECFCVDAGWFSPIGESWHSKLGDWQVSPDRFGEEGLRAINKQIHSKGMLAGVWLEMEVCGQDSLLARQPDHWFLQRNGRRVGGEARMFLDFRNPEVRKYMHDVVERLCALGVTYIKNDYNDTVGFGVSDNGASAADGALAHARAFLSFIDELLIKHPQLILENCASGALRQDYGTLSHFHLQSYSDQEIYTNAPAILSGSLAAIVPEQLGIWAYPYPVTLPHIDQPGIVYRPEYVEAMKDGEQTVFNLVNGLAGHLYLSGRIDAADDYNKALIGEAIAFAARNREFKESSFPFWPLGHAALNATRNWITVGFRDRLSTIQLHVWRLEYGEAYLEIGLPELKGKSVQVEQVFPTGAEFAIDYYFNANAGALHVHFAKMNQARIFELTIL